MTASEPNDLNPPLQKETVRNLHSENRLSEILISKTDQVAISSQQRSYINTLFLNIPFLDRKTLEDIEDIVVKVYQNICICIFIILFNSRSHVQKRYKFFISMCFYFETIVRGNGECPTLVRFPSGNFRWSVLNRRIQMVRF